MARALIAGCGYVGSALAELLRDGGHEVFGLRRNVAALPPGISGVQVDLTNPHSIPKIPANLDWIVFSAGADGHSENAYRRTYIESLQNLIDALRSHDNRPARFVFTSSTAVYGQHNGEWVDETSPAEPPSFSGRIMLEAERILLECGFTASVLRLGGIYGPGRTRMIESVANGAAMCWPAPPHFVNHQHRDDAARAIEHLLRLENPAPIYIGVDCDPAERCSMLDWIAAQLGVPSPPRASQSEQTRGGSKRCSNKRLLETGFRFRYPTYREGYGELLRNR